MVAETIGKRATPQRICKVEPKQNKFQRTETLKQHITKVLHIDQPWTPLSAVRRSLGAAERNSSCNMVVRPALHDIVDKVKATIKQTVLHGTNCSFALVGRNGCGKSLVRCFTLHGALTMALQQVEKEVEQEVKSERVVQYAITVHLSGALHSDKSRAFKFMARKLCEYCGEEMKFVSSASVEENELFLRQVLTHLRREKRSIVFVLNDMSRFVGVGRSTTLYTLLDLQHTHSGIAIIGVSTFYGVLDLMEKRAKSRFSNQVFSVPALSATREDDNHPKAVLQQMLTLHPESAESAQAGIGRSEEIQNWNEAVSLALSDSRLQAQLDMLGKGGVSCAGLLVIASRACAQVQTDNLLNVECAASSDLSIAIQEAVKIFQDSSYPVATVLPDLSGLQKQLVLAAEQLRDGAYAISFETILRQYRTGEGLRAPEHAVWAAFQSLQLCRVFRPAQRRRGAAGTLKRQPVVLNFRTVDAATIPMIPK